MSISFLVPTHREDRPLSRALDSIVFQLHPDDEVLVIGDTLDGPLPGVERLVARYGSQFKYLPFNAGRHTYGHDQLNYGLSEAQGDYLHVSDDDDVWTPIAGEAMRRAISDYSDSPHLFRFRAHFGLVFWDQYGVIRRDHIGGHCLLAPNVPGKIGRWGEAYAGDFEYLRETIDLHGGDSSVVWHEDLVVIARPN